MEARPRKPGQAKPSQHWRNSKESQTICKKATRPHQSSAKSSLIIRVNNEQQKEKNEEEKDHRERKKIFNLKNPAGALLDLLPSR